MGKRTSGRKKVPVFRVLAPLYVILALLFVMLIKNGHMQLLEPAGYIANIQSKILRAAIIFAAIAGSSIVITFYFVLFRYREEASRRYEPGWRASKKFTLSMLTGALLVVTTVSVLVWKTAHLVDPYRPISGSVAAVTIQVVALQWKWLFLYPNDHIASVNMLEIPTGTPIALQLTADAPMNSFWVPRLSGQVYAMTGMITQLHIEADQPGNYAGTPAEMSGDGFAGMVFTVHAVTPAEYTAWKASAHHVGNALDPMTYAQLAKPSSYVPPALYTLPDTNLFENIMLQYMAPGATPGTLQIRGKTLQ